MRDEGLSNKELERVLNFEGYGNKAAHYWFLGMEEGGGSIDDLRLRSRRFGPVEDLHSALDKIDRVATLRRHVPTWRVMSKLVMALSGTPEWEETSKAREYQAQKLGRDDGETFLTELMPLPCPNINDWPYPMLFATKADYIAEVRPG